MRITACSIVLLAAAATAQNPATYARYGQGCNGAPQQTCLSQNATNPTLTGNTYPNEYAHAVVNTTGAPVTIVGFSIYTATQSAVPGQIETIPTNFYRDAAGTGSTTHSAPDPTAEATGTMDVDATPGWYETTIYPAVTVAPGEAFWISADSIVVQVPDDSGGAPGVYPSYWRRAGTNWAQTGLVNNPIWRVRCLGSTDIPLLSNTGLPVLGQSMTVDLDAGAQAIGGFMILSFDDTQWLGIPTPVPLAQFGLPNCFGYMEITETFFSAVTSGTANYTLNIPGTPTLAGLEFFNQWLVIDPTATTPSGFLVSNAGAGVLGV